MTSPAWHAFHADHFDDAARRAWFAAHLAHNQVPTIPSAPLERTAQEDAWTQLAPGEDEVDWQRRYGVQYLTPGSARIFDASRRFREERARMEETRAQPTSSDEAPPCPAHDTPGSEELAALRARALEAKWKGRGVSAGASLPPGTYDNEPYDASHPYSQLYIPIEYERCAAPHERHCRGYAAFCR